MKLIIEKPMHGEEEHIIIKCHNISPELLTALNAINAQGNLLIAYEGSQIHRVNPADILYIESVDNKTFLYCANDVFESRQKLYELDDLKLPDFLRVSKSAILNLSKVKSLAPLISGRMEAVLTNGEKVVISRQYVHGLKKNLGI